MAWTTTDLTAIENAIASGVLRVRFSDREVQYQSLADLLKARDVIKGSVDSTVSASSRCTYASFTKD
jgi:hypothetical protein